MGQFHPPGGWIYPNLILPLLSSNVNSLDYFFHRMVRNYVKKRAPYDEEAMQNAIKAVQSGSMGYMKAANTFGVKRETLRDQVRKR